MTKRSWPCRALIVASFVAAGRAGAEDVDLAVVHRIKAEAFQGSQVMDHLFYLTDVQLKPEHAKLAAYFNVDNGTAKIGDDTRRLPH
jgi:hypothetical protein